MTSLRLVLHYLADNSTTECEYTCHRHLTSITVSEMKEDIQNEHKIPAYSQNLYFESTHLRDEDTIAESCIREGDTITVRYDTVADIDDVQEVVGTLEKLLEIIEQYYRVAAASPASYAPVLNLGYAPKRIRDLVFISFRDASRKSDANRIIFVHKGGVETLYQLYGLVLKNDYRDTVFQIRYLESVLIQVIGSALIDSSTRIPLLRKLILENPTLDYTLRSFTRVEVPHMQRIVAPSGHQEQLIIPATVQDEVLSMCLQMSQVNTSNLAEIEEYQMRIASNTAVMQQLFAVAFTPSFKFPPSIVAIGTLDNLSSHTDTHVYLTAPNIINNVLEIYRNHLKKAHLSHTRSQLDSMILKSVMATFFSELVCYSADIIPLPLKGKIYNFMDHFMEGANPIRIREHRDKYGISCVDLLPPISLPYSPLELTNSRYTSAHNHTMRELKKLCVEFGILCTHYELLGGYQRKSIVEHRLVDYVVCLPWVVTSGSRAHRRACELVSFLGEQMTLQPPSLINLARAKLAKIHFGLQKAIKLSVHEMVEECSQDPSRTCDNNVIEV